jgi:hypothetical protein
MIPARTAGWPETRVGLALPRRPIGCATINGWLSRSCSSMMTMHFGH